MKHAAAARIEYAPVRGIAGLETLNARGLRSGFHRHFHDTYAFGLILRGVERCERQPTWILEREREVLLGRGAHASDALAELFAEWDPASHEALARLLGQLSRQLVPNPRPPA